MVLDHRALGVYRRKRHIGHDLHRMRIAHRQNRNFNGTMRQYQLLTKRIAFADERNLVKVKDRNTHINGDLSVSLQYGFDDAAQRFHADALFAAEAVLAHKAHKAARAVAALFHLAAVGIENPIAEIYVGTGRRLDDQNLIAAYAEVAIGDSP